MEPHSRINDGTEKSKPCLIKVFQMIYHHMSSLAILNFKVGSAPSVYLAWFKNMGYRRGEYLYLDPECNSANLDVLYFFDLVIILHSTIM